MEALNENKVDWAFNIGDGAFYGPKIDILVRDSMNRQHQCATIQVDFQLPIRFNLQFKAKDADVDEAAKKIEELKVDDDKNGVDKEAEKETDATPKVGKVHQKKIFLQIFLQI